MTFSTEAAKSGSERFCLVKISPRKLLTGGISLGGNNYQYNIGEGYHISNIRVFPIDTNVTFTYVAGVLIATSVTDLLTNTVIMNHDLFLTGTNSRYTSGIIGVDDAEWLPYLAGYPKVAQSMQSIAIGVFSISGSDLSIISNQRFVQNYMGTNDSFSAAPVRVWVCIDSTSNNRVIYDGSISSTNISASKASFSLLDSFAKLSATSGRFGTYEQSTIRLGGTFGAYPQPELQEKAASITIGGQSPLLLRDGVSPTPLGASSQPSYHVAGGLPVAIDTPATFSVADTVTFFGGRFIGAALKKTRFGTVTRTVIETTRPRDPVANTYITHGFYHVQCTDFYGQVGDYIPEYSGWICRATDYVGHGGFTYNFMVYRQQYYFDEGVSGPYPGPGFFVVFNQLLASNTHDSCCLYRDGISNLTFSSPINEKAYCTDNIYYINGMFATPSVVSVGTIGGQLVSAIYWTVNLSALAIYGMTFSPPISKSLRNRFTPDIAITHADCMAFIVKSAGYNIDLASFSQADIDLVAEVAVTFPTSGDEFESCLKNAEYLTTSTLGLLRVNLNREIVYNIIKNPAAEIVDATRDSTNILVDSSKSAIEYQDIYSEIRFTNPQYFALAEATGGGAEAYLINDKAKYLHIIDKKKVHKHCLLSIQNRKAAIAGYLSEPTVEYSLETSSDDLTTVIGDVISLTNSSVLGISENIKAVVVSTNTGSRSTSTKLNEIRGVP